MVTHDLCKWCYAQWRVQAASIRWLLCCLGCANVDTQSNDVGVKMNDIQHEFYKEILSAQHFHLDHDNCLEIIAVKGNANRLTDLANKLIGLKGIIHGKLVTSKMI